MKTIVQDHRREAPPPARVSTVRLGVVVSAAAALAAVLLDAFTGVPAVAIVVAVAVIGFALSWHATGHHDEAPPT